MIEGSTQISRISDTTRPTLRKLTTEKGRQPANIVPNAHTLLLFHHTHQQNKN